mmetsp:Transcript_29586/g.78332  ORF Transcript_29586/g.78332 Transcript_29586/m.78332 type:complete len:276 (-) Transcript_29586:416-1243(-)
MRWCDAAPTVLATGGVEGVWDWDGIEPEPFDVVFEDRRTLGRKDLSHFLPSLPRRSSELRMAHAVSIWSFRETASASRNVDPSGVLCETSWIVLAEVMEFTRTLQRDPDDRVLPITVESQSSSPTMVLVEWPWLRTFLRRWELARMSSVTALSFAGADFRGMRGPVLDGCCHTGVMGLAKSASEPGVPHPGEAERRRSDLSSRAFSAAALVGLPRPRPIRALERSRCSSANVWFLIPTGQGGADSPRVVTAWACANCLLPPARVMSASRPAIGRP